MTWIETVHAVLLCAIIVGCSAVLLHLRSEKQKKWVKVHKSFMKKNEDSHFVFSKAAAQLDTRQVKMKDVKPWEELEEFIGSPCQQHVSFRLFSANMCKALVGVSLQSLLWSKPRLWRFFAIWK